MTSTQHLPSPDMGRMHVGRSWWPAHDLEDSCPCPKAPCGLVIAATSDPACPEHPFTAGKSFREMHSAEDCQDRIDGTGRYAPKAGQP